MLTSQEIQALHRVIRRVFTHEEFEHLLHSRLGLSANRVVAPTAHSSDVWVLEVIQLAQCVGWTHDLVRATYEARPENRVLAIIYKDLGLATPVIIQRAGTPLAEITGLSADDDLKPSLPDAFFDFTGRRGQVMRIEGQVCRVEVAGRTIGTAFLVGPDTVLTCFHNMKDVITQAQPPEAVRFRFDFRKLSNGLTEGSFVGLHPTDWLIDWSPDPPGATTAWDYPLASPVELDYAVLRIDRPIGQLPVSSTASGPPRGWIAVPGATSPLITGMPLAVVQYARGETLKIAIDTEAVLGLNANGTRGQYTMWSQPGSGGSPCFNAAWELVAVHEYRHPGPDGTVHRQGIPIAAIRERLDLLGKAHELGGDPPGTWNPGPQGGQ